MAQLDSNKLNEFFYDVAEPFLTGNIRLHRLLKPISAKFLERACGKDVPDRSTLRKYYLKPIYDELFQKIRDDIGQARIYVRLGEAMMGGKRLYSVIIGKLDGSRSKPYLLDVIGINESANNVNAESIEKISIDFQEIREISDCISQPFCSK